jgi:hypothetical protein
LGDVVEKMFLVVNAYRRDAQALTKVLAGMDIEATRDIATDVGPMTLILRITDNLTLGEDRPDKANVI